MATGAELFVDAMLELGIEDIFTLVGDHPGWGYAHTRYDLRVG